MGSLDEIVVRRGRPLDTTESTVGYEFFIPPFDCPDSPPSDEVDIREAFDIDPPDVPGADIESIDASRLVAPNAWELAIVRWLAEEVGVEPPNFDVSHEFEGDAEDYRAKAVSAILGHDSWTDPSDVPEQTTIRRADTPRGEARATGIDIREWLNRDTSRRCRDVLILVPDRSMYRKIWRDQLRRMELPVHGQETIPLLNTGLGRWLLAVSRLSNWREYPKSKGLLRRVFLSNYLWYKKISEVFGEGYEGSFRGQMRTAFNRLRRQSVRLDDWRRYLSKREPEREFDKTQWQKARPILQTLTRFIVECVQGDPYFDQFSELLTTKDEEGILDPRSFGDDTADGSEIKHLKRSLQKIASRERRESTPMYEAFANGKLAPSEILREEWSTSQFAPDQRVDSAGIRVLPYSHYTGQTSKKLILAGLSEGYFPTTPDRLGPTEEQWARRLGVIGDQADTPANPEAFLQDQILSQLRLSCHAIGECAGPITFSYAKTGRDSGDMYPGSLLSMLTGGWSEEQWKTDDDSVEVVRWADEIPADLSDVVCRDDLMLFANRTDVFEKLPDGVRNSTYNTLESVNQKLEGARHAESAIQPEAEAHIEPGPYTGEVIPKPEDTDRFSASSLQDYAQCGRKYLFGRLLRLEDEEDADDELDSLEIGNAIHLAFHRAATAEIDYGEDEVEPWRLTYDGEKGKAKEQIVNRIYDELEDVIEEVQDRKSSLSAALSKKKRKRWEEAIERWLDERLEERTTYTREEVRIDEDMLETKRQQRVEQIEAEAEEKIEKAEQEIFEPLAEYLEENDSYVKARAKDRFNPSEFGRSELTQGDIRKVLGTDEQAEALNKLRVVREDFRQTVEAQKQEAIEAVDDELENKWEERKERFNQHIVHSELKFGRLRGDDHDPHSVDEPIELDYERQTVHLSGSIDRVDYDEDAGTVAARDYKSSSSKENKLKDKIATGEHLQLPIYGLALRKLISRGDLPHLRDAEVWFSGLEYPAVAADENLRLDELIGSDEEGNKVTLFETGRSWIDAHVKNVRAGHFPGVPEGCPISERGYYCDFESICKQQGRPIPKNEFDDPRETPGITLDTEEEGDSPEYDPADVVMPDAASLEKGDAVDDGIDHLEQDVVVAAGAGSGKTFNLVRRYIDALNAQCEPHEILCMTFTRKAAGEMKDRVRACLFAEDDTQTLPGRLEGDEDRRQSVLMSLSSAPISTIDSLAGDIVDTSRQIEERLEDSKIAQPLHVVTGESVANELKIHTADRFLEALENGDPRIERLTEHVTVGRLRGFLQDAVADGVPDELSGQKDEILETWHEMLSPVLETARHIVSEWNLDELRTLLQEEGEYRDGESDESIPHQMLNALETLASPESSKVDEIASLGTLNIRLKKSYCATDEIYDWLKTRVGGWTDRVFKDRLCEETPIPDEQIKDLVSSLKGWSDVELIAQLQADLISLAEEWEKEFRDYLADRGLMRHEDVEKEARDYLTRAMSDREFGAELAARFPFRHILVDEAQDTSETQIRLIQRLRDVIAEYLEVEPSLFWVGDFKQSIYRFRGAEVDVFEEIVDRYTRDETDGLIAELGDNYRSRPRLLRVINDLFARILPAERNNDRLDPGSEIAYRALEPQVSETEDTEAALEIIAKPGKRFAGVDESDKEMTSTQLALVGRIDDLLNESDDQIAVLVSSWSRAQSYRRMFAKYGIAADIQGGHGLLETRECKNLRNWLETAAEPASDSALVAVAQGPGFGLSDAGLYALRKGFGLTAVENARGEPLAGEGDNSVTAALRFGRLDPDEAVEQWEQKIDGELGDEHREALRRDADILPRLQERLDQLRNRIGKESSADLLETLIKDEGLDAFWFDRGDGKQRVANLYRFLDEVRGFEEEHGIDPRALKDDLDVRAGRDDAGSGGLEASGNADVVITTVWQAKGREWPIVVLPDLEKTDTEAHPDSSNAGVRRVVSRSDDARDVFYSAELPVTKDEPFDTEKTPASKMIDLYRKPNKRAELRRQFYVAVTRAESKVIMSGVFDASRKTSHDEHDLSKSKDWALTFRAATGLEFDEETGQPRFPDESAWNTFVSNGLVDVRHPDDWCEERGEELVSEPTTEEKLGELSGEQLAGWQSFEGEPMEISSPSGLDEYSGTLPKPVNIDEIDFPETTSDSDQEWFGGEQKKGTALHYVMEQWGFGEGRELTEDLYEEALAEALVSTKGDKRQRAIQILKELVGHIRQSPACDDLRRAARRGDVYHEVPVRFFDEVTDTYLRGYVDLVWRDEEGSLHVWDYKAGTSFPTSQTQLRKGEEGDGSNAHEYYPQIQAYALGLEAGLDESVETVGIWYVAGGYIVKWDFDE